MTLKIALPNLVELNALGFEDVVLGGGPEDVAAGRHHPLGVDHPLPGHQVRAGGVPEGRERPTDLPRGPGRAEHCGHVSVGCDKSLRHGADERVDTLVEARSRGGLWHRGSVGAFAAIAFAVAGCDIPEPEACAIEGAAGLIDGRSYNPWPSMHSMTGGETCHVAVQDGFLAVAADGRAWDTTRFDRRDGFSPVGTVWMQLGVALDASTLPPLDDSDRSLAPDASVQLWDLESGVRLRHFTELDAHPLPRDEARSLLVRPLEHMGFDRRIAVVVTSGLHGVAGGGVPAPAPFAALRDGRSELPDPVVSHYEHLLRRLEELGVDRAGLVLAFDFRTSTEANLVAPLDVVTEAMKAALPLVPTHAPTVTITSVRDALDDDLPDPPPGIWREVRGSVSLPHFLFAEAGVAEPVDDEGLFQLDADGLPTLNGDALAYFTLIVPESLQGAAAGSAPWLVFGHGLFRNPQHYLASSDDPEDVVDLANRMGAVVIGTEWRGLTERDIGDAIRVARDPARFALLTDKLVQAVSNQLAMGRLSSTAFVDESFLLADDGQSLVNRDRIHYHGISLGGIEGPVVVARSEVIAGGIFHVPGAVWSTMLERSSNWSDFETFIEAAVFDAADRQRIYAATQLLWDPIDPMHHVHRLGDKPGLWQLSMGDDQVPNFTAETLARTLGLPVLDPFTDSIPGLATATAPLPPGSSALAQFDSLLPRPPPVNRPAPETDSHYVPRHTDEAKTQAVAFFVEGRLGEIIDPCGAPCVVE